MRIVVVVTVGLLLSLASFAVSEQRILILVTMEGVSLQQFTQALGPAYQSLLTHGAIGLANNKTASEQTADHVAATVGAGTRALASNREVLEANANANGPVAQREIFYSRAAFNSTERTTGLSAGELFTLRTGYPVPSSAVVQTGLIPLRQVNSTKLYPIHPGLLGDSLAKAGVNVRVYGNADEGKKLNRSIVTIAMNKQGWVAGGDVSARTLIPDTSRPFGVRTDYDYIYQQICNRTPGAYFCAIESGDGLRLADCKTWISAQQYRFLQQQALKECGCFLQKLAQTFQATRIPYQLILQVTQQDITATTHGDQLTPLLISGMQTSSGLLTSKTTRRPGTVINIDVTATVLDFFHVPIDPSILGYPITSIVKEQPVAWLQADNQQMVATFSARPFVIKAYILTIVFIIAAYIGALLLSAGNARASSRVVYPKLFYLALTALILAPFTFIIAPLLHIYAAGILTLFTVCFITIFALILSTCCKDIRTILAISGFVTSAIIIFDLLTGSTLMKQSILGFDPIAGVRFYGLGNEYSGILISSTLLGVFALLDLAVSYRKQLLFPTILWCVVVFILISLPKYGADFGGMLASLPAFAFAFIRSYGGKNWKCYVYLSIAAIVLLIAIFVVVNIAQPASQQTHIGRAFQDALQYGPGSLFEIALRKLAMNFRLMHTSFWALILASSIIVIGVITYQPVCMIRYAMRTYPILNSGFIAMLVGMLIGFIVNDSGVVQAATGCIYLALPLMIIVMSQVLTSSGTILHDIPTHLGKSK